MPTCTSYDEAIRASAETDRSNPVDTDEHGNERRGRARLGVAALALVLALLGTAVLSNPASAYQTSTYGRAGAVVPYQVETRTKLVYDRGVALYKPGLLVSAPIVYRTPGSTGLQLFTQMIEIRRWNGSAWTMVTSQTTQRTIAAGSQAAYGASFHTGLGGGYYHVVIATAWSNGASSVVTMNGGGDYRCTIFASTCYAAGYVYLTG